MDATVATTSPKVDLLARVILDRLRSAEPGHCARVDYLTREEAREICERMKMEAASSQLMIRVLSHRVDIPSEVFISADKAIELRNRKECALCLFIPADLVDAAVSSLANSFEVIDAREMYKVALDRLGARLNQQATQITRSTFARVRLSPRADDAQRLDFAAAVESRQEAHDLDHAGLELWRVGLIADGGADFTTRLDKNRDCARKLTRPAKLQAMPAERIAETGVDATTTTALIEFFRPRSMNDIAIWSHDLSLRPELTFDRWRFIEEEQSDLREVTVRSFVNAKGEVEKWSHLKRQSAEDALIAEYGPKCSIVVRWSTEPNQPVNLRGWRVEIVPAGANEDDVVEDFPSREIPAGRSEHRVTIKLDIEPEETIDYAVCVRVTPLDAAKNDIGDAETGRSLAAVSDEFYLAPAGEPGPSKRRETRKGALNLSFGRLSYLVSTSESEIIEEGPQWTSASDGAFQLRLNGKQVVHIEVSSLLLALGRRLIKEPRATHSFIARASDIEPLTENQIEAVAMSAYDRETWKAFLGARTNFFINLTRAHPRDTLEVADWTTELAGFALRYGRAYARLLDDLVQSDAPREEIADALGFDTLLVQLDEQNGSSESLITLPTHPLRAAWLASYAQLLREWENSIIAHGMRRRSDACDLALLGMVTPANTPAFSAHPNASNPFVYFQNLQFFYGVALPANVTEPQRRLDDLAVMLGVDVVEAAEDEPSTERLGQYLERFLDTHPYVETLAMTTVNPDRGELLAEALQRMLEQKASDEDDDEGRQYPRLDMTAYIDDPTRGALQALERVRRTQLDQRLAGIPDERHPALAVTLQPRVALDRAAPEDAHLALVSDLTRPAVRTVTPTDLSDDGARSSFSLYGLVARLVSTLSVNSTSATCRYTIAANSTSKGQQHPVTGFTDALLEMHTAQLAACAIAFGGAKGQTPALEVTLDAGQQRTLARLHERTNWVITCDRHFALEYYDSPRIGQLADLAEMYVLDYTPEFTEGMGRRMLATTSWRDEVTIVLRRAMEELGLRAVESSVRQALQTLKTVSGGLALQTLFSSSNAAAAAGLAIVTARLKSQGRLEQAVLIPVDLHPSLFTRSGLTNSRGERRCDLVLIGLQRGIVNATFIEVKWRRGNAPLDDLTPDMFNQMDATARAMEARFFNDSRADGALQRSHLANVLRFYFERAKRYGLLTSEAQTTFMENLSRLEKTGLTFRPVYEGYIVNLDGEQRKAIVETGGKIIVLTSANLEDAPEFSQPSARTGLDDDGREAQSVKSQDNLPPNLPAIEDAASQNGDAAHRSDTRLIGESPSAQSSGVSGEEPDSLVSVDLAPAALSEGLKATSPVTPQEDPPIAPSQVGIALGEAHGEIVRWEPSVKGSPHLFISGIPGQGKSWTTLRLLTELGRQGVPALVLDFHGSFAEDSSLYTRTVHPAVLDANQGLPFSPFDISTGEDAPSWNMVSDELAEIFAYVAGLGEIQSDALRQAIREAYIQHGFGEEGEDALEDLALPTTVDVLRNLERLEASHRTANVLARCRPLLEMNLFRPRAESPDFISLARSGLVIDLHRLYRESVQLAAGAFVLRKIYRDMFHWGGAENLRLAIVLDEAHRLARDVTLPKIMKEGRKFGVSVIVASQGLADFHRDIVGNAGAKVLFRTNYPESRKIAGFIQTRPGYDLARHLEQLAVGHAFVQTPDMPFGAMVTMFAPEDKRR